MKYYNNNEELLRFKYELKRLLSDNQMFDSDDRKSSSGFSDKTQLFILSQLRLVIQSVIGTECTTLRMDQHLKDQFGIRQFHKKMFTRFFNSIVRDMQGNNRITQAECVKLETITDCVNLIRGKR